MVVKSSAPRRQVCPLCGLDDAELVRWTVEGPGLWRYTCENPAHTEFAWLTTGRDPLSTSGHDGLAAEIGIYDDLLECFIPGEPFVEYGIVEYRYAQRSPDAYKRLVGLYSHTRLKRPLQYSASAFIGAAMGKLGREGLLARRACPATGYWDYNVTLNAWALSPGPDNGNMVSWREFALTHKEDPDQWPLHLVR